MKLILGDITTFKGDAIVNPANSYLSMGGGLALTIKKKAGPEVEEEARQHTFVPVGEAVATSAGNLPCEHVIHAPTMKVPERIPPENVFLATRAAVKLAEEMRLKSVALPAMGCGVGGVPYGEAARQMKRALNTGIDVTIYVSSEAAMTAFKQTF
ncbi:MAG: macro domain-containing protein [Candidatus Diapherotrites archaeon]|nr:macro domain-containing protein [Candidatus Diapherotrites archaeon]